MKFSKLLFGKDLHDLSITDIESFFSEAKEESNILEFKSGRVRENGNIAENEKAVLRTICGFLNSEGGLLIWGSPVSSNEDGKDICVGSLEAVAVHYQKDQIMAMIANRVIPSPQGISFCALPSADKFVYLFDVPRSEYSPHQFQDKYFMRMDGQTKAAPHHYVEALFKKLSFPNLEAYLKLENYYHEYNDRAILDCSVVFRNQTPYQNDFNLHYRVFSSHGTIVRSADDYEEAAIQENPKNPGDYIKAKVADVIYYGNWIDDWFTIVLSRTMLHQANYHLHVRLQFGAKYSPMKICHYDIVIGETMMDNLQQHIILMEENRFFNIHEESMGTTDAERLKKTLGR